MKKNILLMAALLGAMVWTSCERAEAPVADDPEEQVDTKTWAITVRAVKIDNPKTKGLSWYTTVQTAPLIRRTLSTTIHLSTSTRLRIAILLRLLLTLC